MQFDKKDIAIIRATFVILEKNDAVPIHHAVSIAARRCRQRLSVAGLERIIKAVQTALDEQATIETLTKITEEKEVQ